MHPKRIIVRNGWWHRRLCVLSNMPSSSVHKKDYSTVKTDENVDFRAITIVWSHFVNFNAPLKGGEMGWWRNKRLWGSRVLKVSNHLKRPVHTAPTDTDKWQQTHSLSFVCWCWMAIVFIFYAQYIGLNCKDWTSLIAYFFLLLSLFHSSRFLLTWWTHNFRSLHPISHQSCWLPTLTTTR